LTDADPNFHLIKIWLGRCNLPGITALISPDVGEPHNKPLITGGATQYVIRYDLEGTFVGISPAKRMKISRQPNMSKDLLRQRVLGSEEL